MTASQAMELARHCLEEGEILLGKHAREQMMARCISFTDVTRVLRTGVIRDPAEFDVKFREWKYRISGSCPDDRLICVVVCFKPDPLAFVITVFELS